MNISSQLSMQIAKLIENYPEKGESASVELRRLVAQERVLPLFRDIGGVLTINVDGEIRSFLWNDTWHGQVEYDPRIRNLALFQGSKEYPELKILIEKPSDAHVCSYCSGTGIPPMAEQLRTDAIVCYCGGLGWIP
jgi:hypothetical protein